MREAEETDPSIDKKSKISADKKRRRKKEKVRHIYKNLNFCEHKCQWPIGPEVHHIWQMGQTSFGKI